MKLKTLLLSLLLSISLSGIANALSVTLKDGKIIDSSTQKPYKGASKFLTEDFIASLEKQPKGYLGKIFKVTRKLYIPNNHLDSKVELNGTVVLIFKGWVGKTLKQFVRATVEFKNNVLNGKTIIYHPSGIVEADRTYVNGKIDGVSKIWYENGALWLEHTSRNGVRHGTREFYKSGKLRANVKFENGEPVVIMEYNEDGTIEYEKDYRNKL